MHLETIKVNLAEQFYFIWGWCIEIISKRRRIASSSSDLMWEYLKNNPFNFILVLRLWKENIEKNDSFVKMALSQFRFKFFFVHVGVGRYNTCKFVMDYSKMHGLFVESIFFNVLVKYIFMILFWIGFHYLSII